MIKRHGIVSIFAIAALSLSAVQTVQAASLGFAFIENSLTDTLTTNLAGAVVTAVNDDTWKIDISGTAIGSLDAGYWATFGDHVWLDDEAGYINRISRLDATTFLAESGILLSGFTPNSNGGSFCGTSGPLANGRTCYVADSNPSDDYFATWIYETTPAAVPEPMTLALMIPGLAGIAFSKRKKG